jgi:DNA topoisomerase-2
LVEFGKLKIFDSDYDIVNYFVEFRLKYYEKRKQFLIKKLKENILMLSNKAKFIKYIIENKIKINNVPKSDVIINIEKFKLDKIDSSYDYLLKMPIYSLTKELYEKLIEDISIKNKELLELKSTKPVDMYLDDLNELKSKIK